jgi:hypothetical protein
VNASERWYHMVRKAMSEASDARSSARHHLLPGDERGLPGPGERAKPGLSRFVSSASRPSWRKRGQPLPAAERVPDGVGEHRGARHSRELRLLPGLEGGVDRPGQPDAGGPS